MHYTVGRTDVSCDDLSIVNHDLIYKTSFLSNKYLMYQHVMSLKIHMKRKTLDALVNNYVTDNTRTWGYY